MTKISRKKQGFKFKSANKPFKGFGKPPGAVAALPFYEDIQSKVSKCLLQPGMTIAIEWLQSLTPTQFESLEKILLNEPPTDLAACAICLVCLEKGVRAIEFTEDELHSWVTAIAIQVSLFKLNKSGLLEVKEFLPIHRADNERMAVRLTALFQQLKQQLKAE